MYHVDFLGFSLGSKIGNSFLVSPIDYISEEEVLLN